MRLLFTLDSQDYDPSGPCFVRPSARCIVIKNHLVAMLYSQRYQYYAFPGGGIEPGESRQAAMMREAREEAGLVVLADSIRQFGYVHRVQKSTYPGTEYFLQDNYYYLCQAEETLQSQRLDANEAAHQMILRFVRPEYAIAVNRKGNHGSKTAVMLERENKVLELLKQEGYFD